MYRNDKDRILSNIAIDPTTDCWVWCACKDRAGYGYSNTKGRTIRAHRLSYILFNGEITSNLFVCHKCDNPSCVNPKHLWLGTMQDNLKDRDKKQRTAKGCGAGNVKLNESLVKEIRKETASNPEVGRKYAVSASAISCIRGGRTWKHVV
jgi:hypothetical protein